MGKNLGSQKECSGRRGLQDAQRRSLLGETIRSTLLSSFPSGNATLDLAHSNGPVGMCAWASALLATTGRRRPAQSEGPLLLLTWARDDSSDHCRQQTLLDGRLRRQERKVLSK